MLLNIIKQNASKIHAIQYGMYFQGILFSYASLYVWALHTTKHKRVHVFAITSVF